MHAVGRSSEPERGACLLTCMPLVTRERDLTNFSVAGPSTRRLVRPPADSRRGSNSVFHKFSNCLDNFELSYDTVLATEQCFYTSVLPTV